MDLLVQTIFWIVLAMLIGILVYESFPVKMLEGFQSLINVGDSKFWAKFVPRRGDVGPEQEESGLLRDSRYFSGYADLQRFGVKTDFCRFIQQGSDEKNKFLACALGGTENLSSTSFRSQSVQEGFILGRDDYMPENKGNERAKYCRIMKQPDGSFLSQCNMANEFGFDTSLVPDLSPPEDIAMLLQMYDGCVFWLRFRDDMLDYAQNLYVNSSGGAAVQENPPKPEATEGLQLNGLTQYLRIGDDPYLAFGSEIQLRSIRAFQVWVRFDEFTNNAHIFDFGNGAGIDNVWLGILNRGNLGTDAELGAKKGLLCGTDSVVPDAPSGAQPQHEISPQELMETTNANVEKFTCEGFSVMPNVKPRAKRNAAAKGLTAKTADLCYEIWDKDQRKMRLTVPQMFQLGTWTHVVITAEGTDSFRPDIAIYKNGSKVLVQPSGWLPQTNITERNYIGKSNWSDITSQYANKDELLKGAVFDLRAYIQPLDQTTITNSYKWGSKLLGLV